ncbi:hypothetical protein X777_12463 [Ooceraea biroi]|uniref:Uncharacterized protein n=1 Tax=Ooceraea biroi TaxID=2015173 RepID=A0A026W2J4_OOCBI|nr:hypothetical protein X777_12463 [Ooceraea biroi]
MTFRWNGGQEAQVRESVREAMGVMGKIWGRRRFGGDWGRKIKLFDWLVGSSVVERIGAGREGAGKVHKVGVEGRTPGYIREEETRGKLRTRLRRRAMGYEKKLAEGGGSMWARTCWKERQREQGREIRHKVEGRDLEIQQQKRYETIEISRWNTWYRELRTLGRQGRRIEEGRGRGTEEILRILKDDESGERWMKELQKGG